MLNFKIIEIDIFENLFFGNVEFHNDDCKVNIQNEKKVRFSNYHLI